MGNAHEVREDAVQLREAGPWRINRVALSRRRRVISVLRTAANDLGDHATGTVRLSLPLESAR